MINKDYKGNQDILAQGERKHWDARGNNVFEQ